MSGRNITLDVAHGAQSTDSHQTQSKGGEKGGTTGGFKLGVGLSAAGGEDESMQGTSTATRLNAGGDINLDAKNDLTLIGTEATAERDIKLKAGNDLKILSAQNASSSDSNRRSWGPKAASSSGKTVSVFMAAPTSAWVTLSAKESSNRRRTSTPVTN